MVHCEIVICETVNLWEGVTRGRICLFRIFGSYTLFLFPSVIKMTSSCTLGGTYSYWIHSTFIGLISGLGMLDFGSSSMHTGLTQVLLTWFRDASDTGCFLAIVWARARSLPPTLSSTASTSLLHVGSPNLSTWEIGRRGGGKRNFPFHSYVYPYPQLLIWVCGMEHIYPLVTNLDHSVTKRVDFVD